MLQGFNGRERSIVTERLRENMTKGSNMNEYDLKMLPESIECDLHMSFENIPFV